MKINAVGMAILSRDPVAAAQWFVDHFGFTIDVDIGWFVNTCLESHENVALAFVHRDHESSPEVLRGKQVAGTLLAFVVDDVDAEHERLHAKGIETVLPLVTEPWGQRRFQVMGPDGLVVEILQVVEPSPRWLAEHGFAT